MRVSFFLLVSLFLTSCTVSAQKQVTAQTKTETKLPYYQIPDYPEKMTGGAAIGRVIDGLGYRYYWATEDLRAKDLAYEPGNGGQSAESVLRHLHGLSLMIMQSAKKEPNVRPLPENTMTWEEQRAATLQNFKIASDIFKAATDEEMATFDIIFQRGEQQNKVPVWHLFNGPLDDAIYHVGQIVSFRRSSGNPMNPFVNVFMGKTKE